MKATWHRYNDTILGQSYKPGTASVFLDYDLANWTFGLRGEHDGCWFSIHFQFGPVALELIYWRIA
jgi:hypothetical protein